MKTYGEFILNNRFLIFVALAIFMILSSGGASKLFFDNDYRAFFGSANPQLEAFEELQNTYTKIDNVQFAIVPEANKTALDAKVLAVVEELTELAWQIPYSIRVDSISNYQHTEVYEDDLIVEDLYSSANELSLEAIQRIKRVVTTEPALTGRLHDADQRATAVSVTIQLPGLDPNEVVEVSEAARKLAQYIEDKYGLEIKLGGIAMFNNAFLEASMNDMMTLVPAMYFVILLVTYLLVRSIYATFAVLLLIVPSIITAMGFGGWIGVGLTPPSASAPTIITTLAVADSIHFLMTYLQKKREGMLNRASILYSISINAKPIFLTSITTAIGFLSLNFSDSPPFHDLGNITAFGVMAAWLFSMTLLPILISFVDIQPKQTANRLNRSMTKFGTFVANNYFRVFITSLVVSTTLILGITKNEINDDFLKYFDEDIQFRSDTDWISNNLTGLNQIQFNMHSGASDGISNPEFLNKVENFVVWARQHEQVTNVQSITDVFKRLNRDLNSADQDYYNIPTNRELAAQYLLLYELSLPFGLDLTNQISIDKSSTQVVVTIEDLTTNEIKSWIAEAESFLTDQAGLDAIAAGPTVMFSYIAERNIQGMLYGTFYAVLIISAIILIALRDVTLGLISLVPNILPAALAFGIWGMLVGQVNMAVAVVTGMALGVIVDDSVHFLTKYQHARKKLNLEPRESVISAFGGVGTALMVTTVILVAGFMILAQSSFGLNSAMASLTAIALVMALIADFTLLPALLLMFDKTNTDAINLQANYET
jgi:predicted RND superfamily exporter protein